MKKLDNLSQGIVLLALLVFIECLQVVIILGLISSVVPYASNAFLADLFQKYKDGLKLERELQIYDLFIVLNIVFQAGMAFAFRKRLGEDAFQNKLKRWIIVDGIWVVLQFFAVLKMLVYDQASWATGLFYMALGGSIVSRILMLWGFGMRKASLIQEPLSLQPQLLLWWSAFVLIEGIQAVLGMSYFLGKVFKPEPISIFLFFCMSAGICGTFSFRSFMQARYSKSFIFTECVLTALLMAAIFKVIVYGPYNQLAMVASWVLLAAAIGNKLFWPQISAGFGRVYLFLIDARNTFVLRALADGAFVILLIAMIYLPDPEAVLARIFIGEQFHHINHFIMAPGWAYVSGCVLNVDIISRYGVGVPVILTTLAKWIGGFNYLNIFNVIVGLSITYYIACYIFLRLWLKSMPVAIAAMFMGIKLQMFYSLAFPIAFTYPSATPVRFLWDIIFMFCILGHLKQGRAIYLWLAAVICGVAIFYMTETGLYLTAAFYAYLLMNLLVPVLRQSMFSSMKGWVQAAGYVSLVPLAALFFFWAEAGAHVWTSGFWSNMVEFSKDFTGGLSMGPFYGGLKYGQFWDLLMGMIFPTVYVLTIVIVGSLCVFGKIPPLNLIVIVISIYGLGANHYYISMSTGNNYYMRAFPYVFVVFYWVQFFLSGLDQELRRKIQIVLVMGCAVALWTNHHYTSYPNIFNFSRNPMTDPLVYERLPSGESYFFHKVRGIPEDMKLPLNSLGEKDEGILSEADFRSDEELKAYYRKESVYPEDALLIQSLTTTKESVALLSSFETELLMQADRKPLFYYFSVFFSHPMRMRTFGTAELYVRGRMVKLIKQLEDGKTPYVFMEKIFLNRDVPAKYHYEHEGLMGILDYVHTHYTPYAYGKYLVALKRN